jgi:hypothetical protein
MLTVVDWELSDAMGAVKWAAVQSSIIFEPDSIAA